MHHVSYAYGSRRVLEGVTFDVAPGQVVGLLGPNGAGKTTLLRICAHLAQPATGYVEVCGHRYEGNPLQVKRLIAFCPDKVNLEENLTIRQNLVLHGELYAMPRRELEKSATELLRFFNLSEMANARVRELSYGMARKALIARALISGPQVLLLDEPTLGLDPRSKQGLIQHIRALADQGLAILLSTQSLSTAERVCDQVILLDRGRVVGQGPPRGILREGGGIAVSCCLESADPGALAAARRQLAGLESVQAVEPLADGLVIQIRHRTAIFDLLRAIADAQLPIRSIEISDLRLEQAYFDAIPAREE